MKILVSGSTGTVGTHLISHLPSLYHDVWRLVRSPVDGENQIFWDPKTYAVGDTGPLEGFDAVVHLCGESIVGGRWTEKKKKSISESRVESTRRLVSLLSGLSRPPRTFICASAVGYYGDRTDRRLTERSSAGLGFLPELCVRWEREASAAADFGARVVNLRIGIVLSPKGGMLGSVLPVFRLGLGGVIGNGGQYISWISVEDLSRIIVFLLGRGEISGPVNAVSPDPVTNREFTKTLAGALRRPAPLPLPEFVVRLVFGEMGVEAMLSSARVFPEKLLSSGFRFHHEKLGKALGDMLSK